MSDRTWYVFAILGALLIIAAPAFAWVVAAGWHPSDDTFVAVLLTWGTAIIFYGAALNYTNQLKGKT